MTASRPAGRRVVVVDVGTDLETVTMVAGPVKAGADVCGIEAAETAGACAVEWSPLPKVQPDAPTVDKTMLRAATHGCMPSEMVGWFGETEPSRLTSLGIVRAAVRIGLQQRPSLRVCDSSRFPRSPCLCSAAAPFMLPTNVR